MKAARPAITTTRIEAELAEDTARLIRGVLFGSVFAAPFWIAIVAIFTR